jgi:predicted membrane protein
MMNKLVNLLPKQLLLIDAWGAGITVLLLAVIVEPFQKHFGMPMVVLRLFSLIACVYMMYSLMSHYFGNQKHALLLKIIAFANTFYGCLIAFFVVRYFEKLTLLGMFYFAGEIVLILSLVTLELLTAYKSSEK